MAHTYITVALPVGHTPLESGWFDLDGQQVSALPRLGFYKFVILNENGEAVYQLDINIFKNGWNPMTEAEAAAGGQYMAEEFDGLPHEFSASEIQAALDAQAAQA